MRNQKRDDKEIVVDQTPQDMLREFFNIGKVKKMFRMGSEIFNAVQPFMDNRTPLNAVKSAFFVGKILVDDLEVWPDDFFDDKWDNPYPADFNKIILSALAGKPYQTLKTSDESLVIRIVHLEDVKFGYLLNTKTDFIDRIFAEVDKMQRAKDLIKVELWKMMKDDNIVLRHVKRPNGKSHENTQVGLEVDDAFRPMPSKRAHEYSAYLSKCFAANVPRAVLLHGPPGTGKSTLARTIVDNLKMKSFRIRVEDIGHIDTSSVFEAINIFEPDAVILDDFDRAESQTSLLETLEFFQRHVKLVIATVNNKNRLDAAILRPGRFDELIQVKQMDEDVVKAVLGDTHAESLDLVKDWPIAFIQEYVKRRQFMSVAEAEESVKELAARVKSLSSYEDKDDDDYERVINSKKIVTGSRKMTPRDIIKANQDKFKSIRFEK